ncbi:serine threonine protein kinase : Putative serine/threonine protein kinase OS=Gemmata sp. Wa1-1 PE=4 SV=1: Pkinase [Gemmataceae bacterium]|nr:serine threonine protein kinase : Putative serine/threonine protein kinase OS=Gemmata sp. Wa1-1 PE=4 SV=1: Pkinase [Gemmataceae bacterium]VTT97312.1 serine threonine protein kinase : Putative serine/threonine protein kinase OS=Gemmata sp. Wa1-1 PE=4 SV=1: Pkinase [Gemmataceae bacterium]
MPDTQPLDLDPADPQDGPAPPPDLTGRTLGDYQLLRRIGAGGMGQVYLARQLSLKRDVAVKLLRNDLATNPTALKRFQAEAEAVAKLNHPNIVHIHQIGEHAGTRYMVLEYVEGRNLREYLVRKGPPDLAVTLSVVRQVVLALQKAHEEGIVHRDIKPENILVTRKVEVKVTDFGLSRFFDGGKAAHNLTQSGVTLGTPLYMSPEQVQGKPVDHRSDVYSLGVTCYHLLAGEPPFKGVTPFDVAIKHVQETPRPLAEVRPDLPPDLCAMVHRMMAKAPDARYQSAREILRDLVRVRDGLAVSATPPAPLSFSATQTNGVPVPSGAVPTTPSATVPLTGPVPAAPPVRWGRWAVAAVGCAASLAAGVLVYAKVNPPHDAGAAPAAGLPDIRPPEKIVSTRERELIAALENRGTSPEKVVRWSIELGLLYVRERRLDEAEARFRKLEAEQFPATGPLKKLDPDAMAARDASAAGRLGEAIVLAYRDTEAAAKASNELVVRVADSPFPRLPPKAGPFERGAAAMEALRLRHPDLGHALADALNRNAAALGKTRLEPAVLEQLRATPRGGK